MARQDMGLFYGFARTCFKRKHRWLFELYNISGDPAISRALPPLKASRPNLQFKELEAQHVSETVYFPGKPDWKPITVSLYDTNILKNPVYEWIKKYYDPEQGEIIPSSEFVPFAQRTIKVAEARLKLLSGCGKVIEQWVFENVWPQSVEFGELDMGQSEVVTIDLTLRYDRAYMITNPEPDFSNPDDDLQSIPPNDWFNAPTTPSGPQFDNTEPLDFGSSPIPAPRL